VPVHAQIMVSAKYCSRWERAEHLWSSGGKEHAGHWQAGDVPWVGVGVGFESFMLWGGHWCIFSFVMVVSL